ncbi:MAG: hypothetical protein H7249_15515 [Chitinophagaceae bacterium]|nr:hypothetical protein [Oligoflexus sp.]
MMLRHKFLAVVIGLLSVTTLFWSFYMFKGHDNRYLRTNELAQVGLSLHHIATGLDPLSKDHRMLIQAAKNLDGLSDGALLIEERALNIATFLMLVTTGFAVLNLLGRHPRQASTHSAKIDDKSLESFDSFQSTLEQTIAELDQIKTKVAQFSAAFPDAPAHNRSALSLKAEELASLESQLVCIKNQAQGLAEHNQSAVENLQRLTGQADDFSSFAAASRLEWNGLAVKLSQFKESQDQVRGKAELLGKMQLSAQELVAKSLEFSTSHAHHSERAKNDVTRMYAESKGTTEIFSKLIQAMSESNGDVDLANKLVRRLSERAEEIVNIIDVIDDIAEQTNQLALNASIEAARAGEQGKGFAVVAAEVRHLAARSSTATRSITELLETIQAEADKASSCLEKTNATVASAHSRIVDVDHRCRETMNLSRQVASELGDLIRITSEHTQDIATIEKQGQEVTRMTSKLIRRLDEVDQINASIHQESNQLAVHTDRLSRLMSRQYFAIQHSERMATGQRETFGRLIDTSTQLISRAQHLRSGFEEQDREAVTKLPHTESGSQAKDELTHRLAYVQTNLTILQGRTRTLSFEHSDDEEIDLGSIHDPESDDDIQIDTNLQKVS